MENHRYYNNHPVPGQAHYWKDLSDIVNTTAPSDVLTRIWTVDEFQPLTPPGQPCFSATDRLSDYTQIPMRGFWYVSSLQVNSNDSPQEHHIQTTVDLKQATWQDNFGKPGSFSPDNYNFDPCFVIENDPPPVLGSGDPQTAKLKTSSEFPVPPGRYVVTVRVTDRTWT